MLATDSDQRLEVVLYSVQLRSRTHVLKQTCRVRMERDIKGVSLVSPHPPPPLLPKNPVIFFLLTFESVKTHRSKQSYKRRQTTCDNPPHPKKKLLYACSSVKLYTTSLLTSRPCLIHNCNSSSFSRANLNCT